MQGLLDWLKINVLDFSRISKIIVITDRFDLQDEKRTNAYKIRDWRSNGGKNFEGKEIKNWDLLNKLDKTRTKLSQSVRKSVRIEYRQRKLNKEADKLSKKGRIEGIPDRKIAIEGHKIGTRLFDGREINYSLFFKGEKLIIHIFRKRPIKVQWEINAEIVSIKYKGWKLIIITDHLLQEKLNRGNLFEVKIKNVYTHHIEIFRTITKLKKSDYLENKI